MAELLTVPKPVEIDAGPEEELAQLLSGVDFDQLLSDEGTADRIELEKTLPEEATEVEHDSSSSELNVQIGLLVGDERFLSWIKKGMQTLHRYDIEAEDIAQAALTRMVGRTIQTQAVRKYAYLAAASIISSIGRNKTVARKHLGHREDNVEDVMIIDLGAQDTMVQMETRLTIRSPAVLKAIQALPWRQREAVVYCYYEGLSIPEAAVIMGVEPGTVKSCCFRGLRHLREALADFNR